MLNLTLVTFWSLKAQSCTSNWRRRSPWNFTDWGFLWSAIKVTNFLKKSIQGEQTASDWSLRSLSTNRPCGSFDKISEHRWCFHHIFFCCCGSVLGNWVFSGFSYYDHEPWTKEPWFWLRKSQWDYASMWFDSLRAFTTQLAIRSGISECEDSITPERLMGRGLKNRFTNDPGREMILSRQLNRTNERRNNWSNQMGFHSAFQTSFY